MDKLFVKHGSLVKQLNNPKLESKKQMMQIIAEELNAHKVVKRHGDYELIYETDLGTLKYEFETNEDIEGK